MGSSGRPARGLFLRASRDIEFVKQHGRRVSSLWFNLLVCRTEGQETKVGIVVGRRFGTAVSRNRVKRRFREIARSIRHHLVGGYSMVVFPKRDALTASFHSVKEAWCSVLLRQGVLRTEAE